MTTAGWYADPADPLLIRYWDGSTWTHHIHPIRQDPPTSTGGLKVVQVVDAQPGTEHLEPLSDIVARRLAAFAPPTNAASWCEDPLSRLQARWWDGQRWTGHVAARPTASVPAGPAEAVADADLGREGVHWPSSRELRYLERCAPATSGWYLDPLAPDLRGRFWDGTWSEQVRPRRDVVLGPALPALPAPGYGDAEDVARTRRSLAAWSVVGALFLVGGIASLFDPRGAHSLGGVVIGVAGLARAYVMRDKLRSLGQL